MDDLHGRLSRERGVGKILADRLIERFGQDLAAMAAATADDLGTIRGLGTSRVSAVREALQLLAELSGPALSQQVQAIEIPTEGATIIVPMPQITLTSNGHARMVGLGLDIEVELGQTVTLEATWDGVSVDEAGSPVLEWSR